MGMTIDLAKDILKHPTDYFPSEIDEANAYAIETMRKYQKIQEIVENRNIKPPLTTLNRIIKVVENGNDD